MKRRDQPEDLGEAFAQLGREIGREFGNALVDLRFVLVVQGAMGQILQGDLDEARDALADLTDEQQTRAATAALRLADMAENANRRALTTNPREIAEEGDSL